VVGCKGFGDDLGRGEYRYFSTMVELLMKKISGYDRGRCDTREIEE
jgi:hypothetical protein